MKKILCLSFLLILVFALTACNAENSSGSEKADAPKKEKTNSKLLTKEEFTKMLSDPKKYKGSKVDYYGRVFTEPEKDDDGTYLQVFAEDNSDKNTIVAILDPSLDVKTDDIVHITGTIKDIFEGENLMGGKVTAPAIQADKIEVSDYATAFAPAIKTIEINKEIDQHGYLLKLDKVEIAEKETRAYVTITNNSNDSISFYTFNTKLVIDGKQYEENNEFNYPDIQSDILPGVTTEGIIAYPTIPESGTLKVFMEGSSNNYEVDIKPFEFEVTY
ncbi:hypothetical protein [Peribacillus loiseleuriae]|uniref:DUF4352 domain-containing protein n=1 Tax=Peribacillus loiseleuriae TaxID=1679170 RepID=A0A0K9GSH3_9BACI|nr:hypothetical protein [Peribacillus loiseleuriae]KMY49580.1 hypothetical protein AC625_08515 [Peribacillus loiseleuriae]